MIELLHIDCMEYMAVCKDNAFDLAIVDPPYGIGEDGKGNSRHRGDVCFTRFDSKKWDRKRPSKNYFYELYRVSVNQIIWGGNYFVEHLKPSMGRVFWDKMIGGDFSDGEMAFTSFNRALKKITMSTERNRTTNAESAKKWKRIHPCQKPVKLYNWLLFNYAKKGQRIIDTHGGSFSSAIAAHYFGCDFTGCEIDQDYFKAAQKRFKNETRQLALF